MKKYILTFTAILALGCSGCSREAAPPPPAEIGSGSECSMDGMLLAEYSGPKAQLHLRDEERPRLFCEVKEIFKVYLEPGRKAEVKAMYVQDTAVIDWKKPAGGWIDARSAVYVVGGSLEGAMGPTYAPFKTKEAAAPFVAQHGGVVMSFDQVVEKVQKEVSK